MTSITTLVMMGLAYLLGSVPFSFLVARTRGVDLRTVGSGNIGGANVWRACGFRPFLVATLLDIFKGAIPTLTAIHVLQLAPVPVILVGASAMLGHTFSIFMGFKGGKAVATGGGVLLAIYPLAVLIGAITWISAFAITRISSVGSLMAASVVVVFSLITLAMGHLNLVYAIFICVASGLIVLLHRANIQRLLAGTENRFQKL